MSVDRVPSEEMSSRCEAISRRLRRVAEADQGHIVFGARAHCYRLTAPVTLELVAQFENRFSIELPNDYRSFLTSVGTGGAGPGYGMRWFPSTMAFPANVDPNLLLDAWCRAGGTRTYREWLEAHPEWIQMPFPFSEEYQRPVERRELDGEEILNLATDLDRGTLLLSDEGCAIQSVLVVSGTERGTIWCWSQDRDNMTPYPPPWDERGRRRFGDHGRVRFVDWYEYWLDCAEEQAKRAVR